MGWGQEIILKLIPDYLHHKKCHKEVTHLEDIVGIFQVLSKQVTDENKRLKEENELLRLEIKELKSKR